MEELQFRLAQAEDRATILNFVHTHWDARDPFLDNEALFSYYFEAEDGSLRFALAEEHGRPVALAGYVPASRSKQPDIWVSFWLADKTCRGAGLELMAQMPVLTGCRHMSCNNIRPKTRVFYEFLGFSTGHVGHFYRLAKREHYHLARMQNHEILPVLGGLALRLLENEEAFLQSGFVMPKANPYKDAWHIQRRYYQYPGGAYLVYAAEEPTNPMPPVALLVVRVIQTEKSRVLRVVDYIGEENHLEKLGMAIEALMQEQDVEYADFYCAGIGAPVLNKAGFTERCEGDEQNIVPNYLEPPLFQNTEYYYFTSEAEHFRLCKADGDQDRPR